MVTFVNAKINLGLYVTGRRPDGYHDLSTCFYPVGRFSGTPANPDPFCDILEVTPLLPDAPLSPTGFNFRFTGRKIDCPLEKNLIYKAALAFSRRVGIFEPFDISLEKHLPDGAGLGGGSADCAFTLCALNELSRFPLTQKELMEIARSLGADCPFFILNRPAYAEGIGEKLTPVDLDLSGKWCLIVKPDVYVSTAEAFRGIVPASPRYDLRTALAQPIEEWRHTVSNDFEKTIFPLHPVLKEIKEELYAAGALYASMSGSGSSLFGIFPTESAARAAARRFPATGAIPLLL